jgi:hypothetical protein
MKVYSKYNSLFSIQSLACRWDYLKCNYFRMEKVSKLGYWT